MNKRQFLKTSGVLVTGSFLSRYSNAQDRMAPAQKPRTNWAGNLTYHTSNVFEPASVAELQQIVKDHASIRPLGTRHAFNSIADSTQAQVTLSKFKDISIDTTAKTVTGAVLWANLHLLFWLSLFPFATAWLGENHFAALPNALYGVVLLAAALTACAQKPAEPPPPATVASFVPYCGPVWSVSRQGYVRIPCPGDPVEGGAR